MDFGRIDKDDTNFDYSLPAETAFTSAVLKSASGGGDLQIHVGAPKWGNKHWLGKLYPPKMTDNEFLREYAKHFNTVEMSATFYTHQSPEQIESWRKLVEDSPDFKFCPKFAQQITHMRRLKNADDATQKFYNSIKGFGNHLGPLFLQLSDNYTPKGYTDLSAYLKNLPIDNQVFVEVRHKDWYAVPEYRAKLNVQLTQLHIGTVISDTIGRRDCVHMDLTIPHAFIRFVATDHTEITYSRLNDWVERLNSWKKQGLQSIWFFIHHPNQNEIPGYCEYFIKRLNKELGANLKTPTLLK